MMEMNVSEAHCLAAMGGVGDSSCMPPCVCVCVYVVIICTRQSDCQSDVCSPLSEGGGGEEEEESRRSMRERERDKDLEEV